MKLKFYLRGLGLGLIVAALILGIHHIRNANDTLSDSEIRERAAALGMVDASSRLIDDEEDTEEMLADIQDRADALLADEGSADDNAADDTQSDSDTDANNVTDVTSDGDEDNDSASLIENTTSEITTDAYDDPGLTDTTGSADEEAADEESLAEETALSGDTDQNPVMDYPTEETSPHTEGSVSDSAGSFTISSGDSSDRVARKLADAGLISSASEFDTFLCSHGYDRVIRTGNYSISAGMSYEDIARLITGR